MLNYCNYIHFRIVATIVLHEALELACTLYKYGLQHHYSVREAANSVFPVAESQAWEFTYVPVPFYTSMV